MARSNESDRSTLDTLHLSKRQFEAIADERDRQDGAFNGANLRRSDRLTYRSNGAMVVTVYHPGGTIVRYAVSARNLSADGVGFLHGGFLHAGTQCIVSLETRNRKRANVVGKVVRCMYLRGKIHEVGVAFREAIDPRQFVECDGMADEAMVAEPPQQVGRVLWIEDSIDRGELMRFMLSKLGVKMIMTDSGEDALALIEGNVPFDLVVTDYHMPGMNGLQFIDALRDKASDLPVVLATSEESLQVHGQATEKGCIAVLTKPFTIHDLSAVLLQVMPLAEQTSSQTEDSVLVSAQWRDVEMRPLILAFLERLEESVEKMKALIADGSQVKALRTVCMQLKGMAGSYGYPQISQAMRQLVALLDEDDTCESLQDQCEQLVSLCRRACRVRHEVEGGNR